MKRACEFCQFWDDPGVDDPRKDSEMGFCRRNAPVIGTYTEDRWPKTNFEDWCGEFAPKPQADVVMTDDGPIELTGRIAPLLWS